MNQGIDYDLLAECLKAAMKEKMLNKDWEVELWACSRYNALIWAKNVKYKFKLLTLCYMSSGM